MDVHERVSCGHCWVYFKRKQNWPERTESALTGPDDVTLMPGENPRGESGCRIQGDITERCAVREPALRQAGPPAPRTSRRSAEALKYRTDERLPRPNSVYPASL